MRELNIGLQEIEVGNCPGFKIHLYIPFMRLELLHRCIVRDDELFEL